MIRKTIENFSLAQICDSGQCFRMVKREDNRYSVVAMQALEKHYKRGFPKRRYKGYEGVMQQYIFYWELKKG